MHLFETIQFQLADFYPHGLLKTENWYKKHQPKGLEDTHSPICRRQKEFLQAFEKLREEFSLQENLYYKKLQSEEALHRENIAIIQRQSEDSNIVGYRNGRAIDSCLFWPDEAYNVEYILEYEQDGLNHVLEQLAGNNGFSIWHAKIEETYVSIDSLLKKIFLWCLEHHQTEGIFFRATLESLLQKDYAEAMRWLRELLEALKEGSFSPNEIGKIHLLKGQLESEYGLHAAAIESLTTAIVKCPEQQEAYFERAAAYFESGNFEKAIEDFLHLDPLFLSKQAKFDCQDAIGLGIAKGIVEGVAEGCIEYIPELLNSCYGLGRGLWAFCSHPVEASTTFVEAALECVKYLKEHSTKEIIEQMVPEIKVLIEQFHELEDFEKGEAIGQVIGKFGVDIFLMKGSGKLYRQLKTANQSMTLQALTSFTETEGIIKEATKYHAHRQQVLKGANLKIQWDKQGKHLKDHKNYEVNRKRSILEHSDPERLVKEHAGTGRKLSSGIEPCGQAGYKEVVDFQEYIGYHIDEITGAKTPSTRGVIHYAKDGVHIVPAKPKE